MLKKIKVPLFVLLGASFILYGCAQTKQYTPRSAATNYHLTGLPSNVVTVHVNDLRPDSNSSDGLESVLKGQVMASLSSEASQELSNRYTLTVDIIEHRSFFTLGNWNASTHFRIRLANAMGKIIGQWDARGTAHRSNMWGYATAEAVGQDSYNIAVADMMSILSAVSVR
jgi:hypothetical protein